MNHRIPHEHLQGQLLNASLLHSHGSADGALHKCMEGKLVAADMREDYGILPTGDCETRH